MPRRITKGPDRSGPSLFGIVGCDAGFTGTRRERTAIGSALTSVTAFALTTAASDAGSGLVDWRLGFLFGGGGAHSGLIGIRRAHRLAGDKHARALTFSGIVIAVALTVIAKAIVADADDGVLLPAGRDRRRRIFFTGA